MNQRALNRQKNKNRTLNRWALKEIQRETAMIGRGVCLLRADCEKGARAVANDNERTMTGQA